MPRGGKKGHENYYFGKKVKYSEFQKVWNDLYGYRTISVTQAAERLGVSRPTFRKFRKKVIDNGDINENLDFLIWDEPLWDR